MAGVKRSNFILIEDEVDGDRQKEMNRTIDRQIER